MVCNSRKREDIPCKKVIMDSSHPDRGKGILPRAKRRRIISTYCGKIESRSGAYRTHLSVGTSTSVYHLPLSVQSLSVGHTLENHLPPKTNRKLDGLFLQDLNI